MMDRKGTDREAGLATDEEASSAPGIGATSPPASEVAGRTAGKTTGVATPDTTTTEPLLAADEATRFQDRWEQIQSMFVDQPQQSVEHADQLVAELMQHLARLFAQEREGLERQWSGGGVASTEDLRVALRRYRSFFQRLLST